MRLLMQVATYIQGMIHKMHNKFSVSTLNALSRSGPTAGKVLSSCGFASELAACNISWQHLQRLLLHLVFIAFVGGDGGFSFSQTSKSVIYILGPSEGYHWWVRDGFLQSA